VALDGDGHRWLAVSFLGGISVDGAGELDSSSGRDIALIELDEKNELLRSWRYGDPRRSEVA
jgi:hypothetical protein